MQRLRDDRAVPIKALMALACLALCSTAQGLPTGDLSTAKGSVLIHYCRALYLDELFRKEWNLDRSQRIANRYFRSRTRSQLRSQLMPVLNSLHRATYSYVAVAYVLAYYGVNVTENVKGITYALDFYTSKPRKVTKEEEQEIEKECEPRGDLAQDNAVDAIRRIYERHPSDRLWVITLQAWTNTHSASEGPDEELADAFLRHPAPLLRAWTRVEPDLGWLAHELAFYGYDGQWKSPPDYTRVRTVLRRLMRSKDHTIAHLAVKLRRAFVKAVKDA